MTRKLVVLGAVATLAVLAGCESGPPGAGPWMDLPPDAAGESSAELFFSLSEQQTAVNQNRAYHAFLVWADGQDESQNFGQRIVRLENKGAVEPSWRHDPLKPLTRGRLASMICRYLHVRGGVSFSAFGPIERTSRRELEFRRVMLAGGGDCDPVSAAELVNILKRADEMLADGDREGEPNAGPPASESVR